VHIGDQVELRSRFEGTWSSGFEIAAVVDGGYSVRRTYDGELLPAPTGTDDIRLATAVDPFA
jgi:hypothetical protein